LISSAIQERLQIVPKFQIIIGDRDMGRLHRKTGALEPDSNEIASLHRADERHDRGDERQNVNEAVQSKRRNERDTPKE